MENNIGQICSGLADLFLGILNVYEVESRRIRGHNIISTHPLYEKYLELYTWDGHSTVEVKIDDKWIVTDPTFFMLPKLNAQYISIEEGINALLKDKNTKFEYEHL